MDTCKILTPDEEKHLSRPFVGSPGLTIIMCGPGDCVHDFTGWRNFEDGTGGEMACSKCGLGAMQYTLQTS